MSLGDMLEELQQIALQREALISSLETASEQQRETLQAALTDLENSQASLTRAIELYTLFGDLVDERQTYLERLQKERNIWRLTTMIAGAFLLGMTITWGVTK